ncbi:MAG: hypothetical protein H6R00_4267 [Proteobacteria bacterium]|nr:hypothetical protein [Pseudomonadota bacterium]
MRGEILVGPERRRRWSGEEKRRIVGEADADGAIVSEVARRHDITRQHIYQWRRELRDRGEWPSSVPSFVAVELAGDCRNDGDAPDPREPAGGLFELVLRSSRYIRIHGAFDDDLLARLIRLGEAT